ncbi:MAG: hypothetical protein RIT28_4669, partial [Pseudomonadota bacterium]
TTYYSGDMKSLPTTDVPGATSLAPDVRGFTVSPRSLLADAGRSPKGQLTFTLLTLAEGGTQRTVGSRTVQVGPPPTAAELFRLEQRNIRTINK